MHRGGGACQVSPTTYRLVEQVRNRIWRHVGERTEQILFKLLCRHSLEFRWNAKSGQLHVFEHSGCGRPSTAPGTKVSFGPFLREKRRREGKVLTRSKLAVNFAAQSNEVCQLTCELVVDARAHGTLPYDEGPPTQIMQSLNGLGVPSHVGCKLFLPEQNI